MGKYLKKSTKRLQSRIDGYDSIKDSEVKKGFKKPGSMKKKSK